jgi:hypothetical protein
MERNLERSRRKMAYFRPRFLRKVKSKECLPQETLEGREQGHATGKVLKEKHSIKNSASSKTIFQNQVRM